jgi:phage baseplate assembly protein W
MAIVIMGKKNPKINLAPETLEEEVMRNLHILLSTPKFSVPLDRAFGLPWQAVDKPMPVAEAILVAEIMDAVEQYEPRAEIISVEFERDGGGKLTPRIEVEINGE